MSEPMPDILTGVIQTNNVQWINDEIADGINTSYEEALRNHDCEEWNCTEDDHLPAWDSDDDDYLIGDWKWNGEVYVTVEDGEKGYAAIVREFVVQVVWSKRVVGVRRMCSPCYPMQADFDSGIVEQDGILCYALPQDIIGED